MNETVPRHLSDVQAGSGSALATVCASTSPQCVTTLLTVPMVLTSLLFAVSFVSVDHVQKHLFNYTSKFILTSYIFIPHVKLDQTHN